MKQHTIDFKSQLTELGRQLRGIITYGNTTLEEEIYSITPHYNSDLLKSVMKQLDLELTVDIPLNTIINCQIGILVNGDYEMLNYGNYVVYKSEKQEDTGTYKIICYDKMLYSMKEYEPMNITYPIKIRDYINAICNKLGLVFSNINDEFANYKKEIQNELYLDTDGNSLGYTFRDVLDELAEVTASIICINEDTDELEIRYPNETNDTIDEEFLKDINVKFGEKFGTVNVIVLSRSAGADNIYYPSELPENPCEIKIADNQIMNWNDRADYLPDIYNKLNGMNYYINDFSSIGILYYEVGDLYNVKVGENTYQCLMLNDEINVTTGIEEIIHTDMPEKSETDYKKADKTDQKLNQTTLIVDKQAQQIQGVINQIGDRSDKKTTITADIDGLYSKVIDTEDLTRVAEGLTEVTLENCYPGNILELHIYGNNTVFDYLFPRNDLYPSDTLYPQGDSRIVVTDKDGNSKIYELGVLDVLRQNGNVRDEYVLEKGKAKVIRRINKNGTIKTQEEIEDLGELSIPLNEGTNTIRIQNYNANIKAKFAIQSDYTDVFATKVEMDSSITQTAKEINLEVRKKVDENEIISKINQSAEQVSISAKKVGLSGYATFTDLSTSGKTTISGDNITTGTLDASKINVINLNADNIKSGTISADKISGGTLDATLIKGNLDCDGYIRTNHISFVGSSSQFNVNNGLTDLLGCGIISCQTIRYHTIEQISLKEKKKNFEKLDRALDKVLATDIYKYNFKFEKDTNKKHIGLVIGDGYNYSKEITNNDNNAVDLYSMIAVAYKAIQEQQEEIEELKKEIEKLKGGK